MSEFDRMKRLEDQFKALVLSRAGWQKEETGNFHDREKHIFLDRFAAEHDLVDEIVKVENILKEKHIEREKNGLGNEPYDYEFMALEGMKEQMIRTLGYCILRRIAPEGGEFSYSENEQMIRSIIARFNSLFKKKERE